MTFADIVTRIVHLTDTVSASLVMCSIVFLCAVGSIINALRKL